MLATRQQAPVADRLWLARFLADLLDQRFTIPGTQIRVGLDPIIGLLPGIGDLIANLTGSVILLIAAQCGVPKIVLLRMGVNIAINSLVGAIPVFGTVFSIWFRSNAKNALLLERYIQGDRTGSKSDWLFVAGFIALLLAAMAAVIVLLIWALSLVSTRF
jgi:hypothetical protein